MQYHSQQPTASKNLVPISGVLFSNIFSQLPQSTRAQKQQPSQFYPQPSFLLRIRALSVLLLRCPDTTEVETANLILISCPSLMLTCFAGGGPICIYTPGGYIQISVLLHRMSEEAAVHAWAPGGCRSAAAGGCKTRRLKKGGGGGGSAATGKGGPGMRSRA